MKFGFVACLKTLKLTKRNYRWIILEVVEKEILTSV